MDIKDFAFNFSILHSQDIDTLTHRAKVVLANRRDEIDTDSEVYHGPISTIPGQFELSKCIEIFRTGHATKDDIDQLTAATSAEKIDWPEGQLVFSKCISGDPEILILGDKIKLHLNDTERTEIDLSLLSEVEVAKLKKTVESCPTVFGQDPSYGYFHEQIKTLLYFGFNINILSNDKKLDLLWTPVKQIEEKIMEQHPILLPKWPQDTSSRIKYKLIHSMLTHKQRMEFAKYAGSRVADLPEPVGINTDDVVGAERVVSVMLNYRHQAPQQLSDALQALDEYIVYTQLATNDPSELKILYDFSVSSEYRDGAINVIGEESILNSALAMMDAEQVRDFQDLYAKLDEERQTDRRIFVRDELHLAIKAGLAVNLIVPKSKIDVYRDICSRFI